MRLFEVTVAVHIPNNRPMPVTMNEWVELITHNSTLHNVKELRYPLAPDIVERRGDEKDAWLYG